MRVCECVRACVPRLRSLQMINNIRQPRQIQNRSGVEESSVRQPLPRAFYKGLLLCIFPQFVFVCNNTYTHIRVYTFAHSVSLTLHQPVQHIRTAIC